MLPSPKGPPGLFHAISRTTGQSRIAAAVSMRTHTAPENRESSRRSARGSPPESFGSAARRPTTAGWPHRGVTGSRSFSAGAEQGGREDERAQDLRPESRAPRCCGLDPAGRRGGGQRSSVGQPVPELPGYDQHETGRPDSPPPEHSAPATGRLVCPVVLSTIGSFLSPASALPRSPSRSRPDPGPSYRAVYWARPWRRAGTACCRYAGTAGSAGADRPGTTVAGVVVEQRKPGGTPHKTLNTVPQLHSPSPGHHQPYPSSHVLQ